MFVYSNLGANNDEEADYILSAWLIPHFCCSRSAYVVQALQAFKGSIEKVEAVAATQGHALCEYRKRRRTSLCILKALVAWAQVGKGQQKVKPQSQL